ALIAVLWLALNWYLSVAAVFGREGQSFRDAFRHARQVVRRQRSDFAGTAFVFLLLRLLLLAIVLSICGLASGMAATAPEGYAALVLVLALTFFVVSDFFYVARMAAYLALAAVGEQAGANQPAKAPSLMTTSRPYPVRFPFTPRSESEKIVRGRPIHRHPRFRLAIHTAYCPAHPRAESLFRRPSLQRVPGRDQELPACRRHSERRTLLGVRCRCSPGR